MNGERDEETRRLAAIAFTDVVGYTAIAQRDEPLALELLEEHNALLRSVLRQHRVREVKTIGDAFLLEFESALEAVLCAIEIQEVFRERNARAGDNRILLRVGIHVGDVVHRGSDVFGDTVNVASRVVACADEGGIAISEQVYSHVRNRTKYGFAKMLEQRLKNVEADVVLYKVVLPWQRGAEGAERPENFASHSPKNRLAVLPFANISPYSADGYFAEGLTEELISVLSEVKGLRVIGRASVNRYASETARGARQIGSQLNVAYVLEGSVRKSGDKIRIAAQLIDTATEEHVWSGRYDRELHDVFAIQSEIANRVVDSLKLSLLQGQALRVEARKGTQNPAAYVAYLKGRTLLHERTSEAINAAREQFELATREDVAFARAFAGLADTHMLLGDYLFAPVPQSLAKAKSCISRALELDPDIAEARVSLANSLVFDYKFQEAEQEFRRAIALNPSYATAHHWYASCLEHLGRGEEALAELVLAEELDPLSATISLSIIYACIDLGRFDQIEGQFRKLSVIDPRSPLIIEGRMAYHFARMEWDDSLRYLQKMKEADPSDPYLEADLAFIFASTGKTDKAMELIEKLKEVPDSSGAKYTLIAFPYAGLGDLDGCFSWLEKAFDAKEVFFGWFRQYPLLESVRRDPRFDDLLMKANLSNR